MTPVWRQYWQLTKPRVVALICFTAVVGMLLAVPGMVPLDALIAGNLGIFLAASSAAVINQVVDARVDAQMDRTRNRMVAGTLQVSSIFKWFAEDFTRNRGGYASVKDLFARYADELADAPADRAAIRARTVPVTYLEYDWALNDAR